jgi:hypothetical protein
LNSIPNILWEGDITRVKRHVATVLHQPLNHFHQSLDYDLLIKVPLHKIEHAHAVLAPCQQLLDNMPTCKHNTAV